RARYRPTARTHRPFNGHPHCVEHEGRVVVSRNDDYPVSSAIRKRSEQLQIVGMRGHHVGGNFFDIGDTAAEISAAALATKLRMLPELEQVASHDEIYGLAKACAHLIKKAAKRSVPSKILELVPLLAAF